MNWEMFYLICFVAGLMLSVVALVGGMGHLHFGGHVHVPHSLAGAAHGVSHAAHAARGGARVPWWNGFSAMIFLCWFGAAGYLLTRYGGFVASVTLALAAVAGVAGGAIVFVFLTRVMLPHERELTAEETEVVGAVGTVSAPIFVGGTGEILYQQLGAVRSVPARAEDGGPISKQEEVFVVRYERGIAYVKRWEEAGIRE
jgi:uncharacterized membrane protein